MLRLSIFVLVASALTACGDPPNVAGTCTANTDCDEGLTCDTTVPMGYCTKTCTTAGSTDQCPEDSVCDALSGATLGCVKICSGQSDCREDLSCNGVSGSEHKACKPT